MWPQKRAEFQKRFDDLSQENIQGLITDLNTSMSRYISRGGLSQDPNNNQDYNTIIQLTQKAENIKSRYTQLNDDIMQYLGTESKNNDLAGLLAENGELQKQINRLEKITQEMKVDVESAIARDELLRSRNTDVTKYKLFLLGRPIRRGLVPYLWAIAVLFIGVGLVILRMTVPTIGVTGATMGASSNIFGMILEFITNKIVLGSLLTSALIVIVFLSLKIAGVFGK
jgi:hypothetical protein